MGKNGIFTISYMDTVKEFKGSWFKLDRGPGETMPLRSLLSEDSLKTALDLIANETKSPSHWIHTWQAEIVDFLKWIEATPLDQRDDWDFQKRLWDDNPISSVGMGTVKIEPVLNGPEFCSWVAALTEEKLPTESSSRSERLNDIHREFLRFFEKTTTRIPWVKMFRVIAALFPLDFTTLSDRKKLRQLHDRMFQENGSIVDQHLRIMKRLNHVLGPAGNNVEDQVRRMTIPWMLYEFSLRGEEDATTEVTDKGGESRLVPLPADRRRRGLTALSGYFSTMRNILQAVESGLVREDLVSFLRSLNPTYKDSSHGTIINVLIGEFGVLQRDGNVYRLTPTGEEVLETGDQDELAERLLTGVLGVDHALVYLRDHGPCQYRQLLLEVQKVNPGWTTLYSPSSLGAWLKSLKLIDETEEGDSQLTERGVAWSNQVHWVPEILVVEPEVEKVVDVVEVSDTSSILVEIPSVNVIHEHISKGSYFPERIVAELHAGVWAHPRRHFAILTGISGSGKTLLARRYASALTESDGLANKRVLLVPVQPGWYDSGPILGYVNPIKPDSYVRTPFLEFLLTAAGDPEHPYVVILDEMNLSRPEQYLAPVLSAMETGDHLHLHQEQEGFDGVTQKLLYPTNFILIGTVNMDETTHGLSDKVLDRAFTIEFWEIDVGRFPGWNTTKLPEEKKDRVLHVLTLLAAALSPARLHFGWRIINEVLNFLERTAEQGSLSFEEALDSVVFTKIVPKLRGEDTLKFQKALEEAESIAKNENLARCEKKIRELRDDLSATGSARFWR